MSAAPARPTGSGQALDSPRREPQHPSPRARPQPVGIVDAARDKFDTLWEEFHFAYIACPDYGLQCDQADATAYADDRTRDSPYRPDLAPPRRA